MECDKQALDDPHKLRHLQWAVEGGALFDCTLYLRFTKSGGPADVSVEPRSPVWIQAGQVHMSRGCPLGLLVQLVRATLQMAGTIVDRVNGLLAASMESSLPLYPPQVVRSGRPPPLGFISNDNHTGEVNGSSMILADGRGTPSASPVPQPWCESALNME